jgi:O-antigen ligase
MSAWPSQPSRVSLWRHGFGTANGLDLLVVPFLGVTLLVRVLTDDLSSADSHHSGNLNLSGGLAVLFILVAIGLLIGRRRGLPSTILAGLWLCVWTAVAVSTRGASAETLREGVREGAVVALAVIVYNARGAVTVAIAARLVQLIGLAAALLALYQLVTHTGADIAGELRSNGTFAHPDSAAMFFAIAATASLWRYLDCGRHRSDALLLILFAAALVATFSLDGLITLVVMLIALGMLRPGGLRVKLGPCVIAGLVALAFFATPLGSHRIRDESSTSLATAERGDPNSSLAWRLDKWKMLLSEWERAPVLGQGLGTTITGEVIPGNLFAGEPPLNEYVRYLVETGVIGFSILLMAVTILILRLARAWRSPGTLGDAARNAPALAIVILFGCLVNSLADNTFLNSPTCYAAALIVVAVMGLPCIELGRTSIPRAL